MKSAQESDTGTPEEKSKVWKRPLLLSFVLMCALWGARSCFALIGPNSPRITKYDLDCIWLMTGIEPTHTFSGTLRWWTGAWCCDFVPYYRPLTSLFFWLEYRAFGPMGLQGFTAVHLISHLIMVVLCVFFFAELMGWRRAVATVSLWCLHVARFFGLGNTEKTFPVWKDSCDIWCCICYISSLWLFLRYLRNGRRLHLALALCAFVVAITFKEMAYTLPAMVLLLLWYERQLRPRWRLILPYAGITLIGVVYRFWALNGPGFKNGTNGAWWHRTLVDLVGPPAMFVLNADTLPAAVALLLVALLTATNPARKRTALWLGGSSVLLFIVAAVQARIPVGDMLLELTIGEIWQDIVYIGLCLLLAIRFLLNKRREQWFGYGWAVISHIPLMAMPVGDHGFYLVALGWSLWLWEALEDGIALCRVWWVRANDFAAVRAAGVPSDTPTFQD